MDIRKIAAATVTGFTHTLLRLRLPVGAGKRVALHQVLQVAPSPAKCCHSRLLP